ncbi:MAG: hypothetical protein HYU56_01865 [Candidatus Aenigmarchaeota archaeon]|nr:hypothetical protein [Candidatus Aenigmarchaeota archaeon]
MKKIAIDFQERTIPYAELGSSRAQSIIIVTGRSLHLNWLRGTLVEENGVYFCQKPRGERYMIQRRTETYPLGDGVWEEDRFLGEIV